MIPAWKLRRELKRLVRKATFLPLSLLAIPLSTPYYDFIVSRKRTTSPGHVPERDKIAIYVIFPHKGLARSHLKAIEHIAAKGYAPLVVSNLPLGDAEREEVLARCWRLIERPNYGYDFGGYRDGVLSIADRLGRLKRLVLLNDSCWFPLPGSDDWLGKAEALDADYVGAASSYAVVSPDPDDVDRMVWNFDTERKDFHYCSFALSMSGRVTADPKFLDFWKRFILSNVKARVVRRGEMGLTRWAVRHGFSHASVYDARRLDEEFRAMPEEDLLRLVERLVMIGDPRPYAKRRDILREMKANGIDRNRLEKFALLVVARLGMSYVLADHLIARRGFPFLKKSPIWIDDDSSRRYLEIIDKLEPEADYIHAEARELIPKKMPSMV